MMGPFRAWQVSRAGKKANCYNSLLRIRHCNSSLSSWLPPRRSTSTASSPSSREPGRHRLPGLYPTGAEGRARVGAAAQPVRGVTRCMVRWRGHPSADDGWLRPEEPAHCPEKVAEQPQPHAAGPPPAGPGPRPGPRLLQPLRASRHRLRRPTGFGSRFRPGS